MDRLCPQVFAFFPFGCLFYSTVEPLEGLCLFTPPLNPLHTSYLTSSRWRKKSSFSSIFHITTHAFIYFLWLQSNNSLLFSFSLTDTGSRLFEDTAMTPVPLESPHLPE
jgi:hypothetical protein